MQIFHEEQQIESHCIMLKKMNTPQASGAISQKYRFNIRRTINIIEQTNSSKEMKYHINSSISVKNA